MGVQGGDLGVRRGDFGVQGGDLGGVGVGGVRSQSVERPEFGGLVRAEPTPVGGGLGRGPDRIGVERHPHRRAVHTRPVERNEPLGNPEEAGPDGGEGRRGAGGVQHDLVDGAEVGAVGADQPPAGLEDSVKLCAGDHAPILSRAPLRVTRELRAGPPGPP